MTQPAGGDEWTGIKTDLKDNGVTGAPNPNISGQWLGENKQLWNKIRRGQHQGALNKADTM